MEPIWKDRVWLVLLLGPFVWAGIVTMFTGWAHQGAQLLALFAQGMCINVGLVSMFLPWIGGRVSKEGRNER